MPPKPIPKSDDPPTPKADEDKKKEKKKDEEDKENVQPRDRRRRRTKYVMYRGRRFPVPRGQTKGQTLQALRWSEDVDPLSGEDDYDDDEPEFLRWLDGRSDDEDEVFVDVKTGLRFRLA